jgi:tetratricopeptide (TPR) repeat protein
MRAMPQLMSFSLLTRDDWALRGRIHRDQTGHSPDPLSSPMHFALASAYCTAHRFDEAIEALARAVELESENALAHALLGYTLMYKSRYESVEELQKGVQLSENASAIVACLGEVYAAMGKRDEAHMILEQLHRVSKHQYVTSYPVARIYMALGETEEALRWLEAAYSEHSAMMVFLKTDPRFAELHPRASLPGAVEANEFS